MTEGATDRPPGDSLQREQRGAITDPEADLTAALLELLERTHAEYGYSQAKGSSAYHSGMQDGLHYASDALAATLRAHGIDVPAAG